MNRGGVGGSATTFFFTLPPAFGYADASVLTAAFATMPYVRYRRYPRRAAYCARRTRYTTYHTTHCFLCIRLFWLP